jgi:hypothetical protein
MFDPNERGTWPAVTPSRDWKLVCTWIIGILSFIGILVCIVSR